MRGVSEHDSSISSATDRATARSHKPDAALLPGIGTAAETIANDGVVADRPNHHLPPRNLARLQHSAGNQAVSRLVTRSMPRAAFVQRQHLQNAQGRYVGDLAGAAANVREDLLAVMGALHRMWSYALTSPAPEFAVVTAHKPRESIDPAKIPNTIAALKRNTDAVIAPPPALAIFGLTISRDITPADGNAKSDILALQDTLLKNNHLPAAAQASEKAAVTAGTDKVLAKDIPLTLAALTKMKAAFVNGSMALLAGTTDPTAGQVSDVNKALSPGIATVGGVPAPFKDKIKSRTYEQDLIAALDVEVAWMFPNSKKKLKGKKMPMSAFEGSGQSAKKMVDQKFGQYSTARPFVAGTAASGANLIDRSLEPPDAADLTRYLIHNQSGVLPVHRRHSAIPDRAAEKAIIGALITSYSTTNKVKLDVIDQAWPGINFRGIVQIQPFEGKSDKQNRIIKWGKFQTLIHEYLHSVTHPNYTRVAGQIGGGKESILIEGGTSYFTDEVWKATFPAVISSDGTLRASVEGAPGAYDPSVIPPIHHYDQIAQAKEISAAVGEANFKAAYFMGKTDLIGFPSVTPAAGVGAAGNHEFIVPPTGVQTLADVATETGATVEALAALNSMPVTAKVNPGDILTAPGLKP